MKINEVEGLENRLRNLAYDKEIFDRRQDFQWERMNELGKALDWLVLFVCFLAAGMVVIMIRILTMEG